jgi:hypothetical protein
MVDAVDANAGGISTATATATVTVTCSRLMAHRNEACIWCPELTSKVLLHRDCGRVVGALVGDQIADRAGRGVDDDPCPNLMSETDSRSDRPKPADMMW